MKPIGYIVQIGKKNRSEGMRICPNCSSILDENSYHGKWIRTNSQCDYSEKIKNNLWIEPLLYIEDLNNLRYVPNASDITKKVNEIISVINKISNPRV